MVSLKGSPLRPEHATLTGTSFGARWPMSPRQFCKSKMDNQSLPILVFKILAAFGACAIMENLHSEQKDL